MELHTLITGYAKIMKAIDLAKAIQSTALMLPVMTKLGFSRQELLGHCADMLKQYNPHPEVLTSPEVFLGLLEKISKLPRPAQLTDDGELFVIALDGRWGPGVVYGKLDLPQEYTDLLKKEMAQREATGIASVESPTNNALDKILKAV